MYFKAFILRLPSNPAITTKKERKLLVCLHRGFPIPQSYMQNAEGTSSSCSDLQ